MKNVPKLFYIVLLVVLGSILSPSVLALTPDEALGVLGNKLSSFEEKKEAFDEIAKSQDSWSQLVLEASLKGELFYSKKTKAIYIKANDKYFEVKTSAPFTGKTRDLKRVAVNNSSFPLEKYVQN